MGLFFLFGVGSTLKCIHFDPINESNDKIPGVFRLFPDHIDIPSLFIQGNQTRLRS